MCGIAGIFSLKNRRVNREMLQAMNAMVAHRGPDAAGLYLDSAVGLAHSRLSIIDLAGGGQPMESMDKSLCITYNGEIFNYLELHDELAARGHRFSSKSDTEVILHLYEEQGEYCVESLNGQWAFAIWDRERHRLFLSRDRLGVRPLFYARTDHEFLFASEIKALLAHPSISRELDLDALDQLFTFWVTVPPRTIFKHVAQLPPGHSMIVDEGGDVTTCPHWQLNYAPEPPVAESDAGVNRYAEALLELLIDSVRIRLRSDVPVGAYLSGGLDSSLITALISRFTNNSLRTFSVSFEDAHFDESSYQQQVSSHLQTTHHDVRCRAADIIRVFPDVVWNSESPLLRTAPAPLFLLSRLVCNQGFKVVVTGEGADELFGGYDIFKEAKIRRFCADSSHSSFRHLLLKKLYPYLPNLHEQPVSYLRGFFNADSQQVSNPFFSHLPRWELTASLKQFFSRATRDALQRADAYGDLTAELPSSYFDWDSFSRAQYLETQFLLPGYILSSQGDRMAMANAVEGRFPFLDHRIVDFSCNLPARLKMKVLNEKFLLKQCARQHLPEPIRTRHKQPYRAPGAQIFFRGRPPEYVESLLSPANIHRTGIFNAGAVERLVHKFKSGRAIGVKDDMALTGILSTELLVHQFVNRFTREHVHESRAYSTVHLA